MTKSTKGTLPMSYAIKNLLFCTWRSPFFFPRRSEHNCDVACTSFPSHSIQRCNMSTGALSRLFRSSHRAQRMTANPGIRIIICRDRRSRKFFKAAYFLENNTKFYVVTHFCWKSTNVAMCVFGIILLPHKMDFFWANIKSAWNKVLCKYIFL